MTGFASGPGLADWLAALSRGLFPVRWLPCLAGLTVTVLTAAVTQSLFDQQAPRWAGWWEEPVGHARELGAEVADSSLGGIVVRLGPPVALAAAVWCLVGGWIARHELLARMPDRLDAA